MPAEDDAGVGSSVVAVAADPNVLYLRGLGCAVHVSMLVERVFDSLRVPAPAVARVSTRAARVVPGGTKVRWSLEVWNCRTG